MVTITPNTWKILIVFFLLITAAGIIIWLSFSDYNKSANSNYNKSGSSNYNYSNYQVSQVNMGNCDFLTEHNKHREANGKNPLKRSPFLTKKAQEWANELSKMNAKPHQYHKDFFKRLSNCKGKSAENVYENNHMSSNKCNVATLAIGAWKNSSGHNANMLNDDYKKVGCGYTDSFVVCQYSDIC